MRRPLSIQRFFHHSCWASFYFFAGIKSARTICIRLAQSNPVYNQLCYMLAINNMQNQLKSDTATAAKKR
jgi:hypothetical protein